ncbi:MAG: SdpI family protein [Brevundimonas sp.]|uniref:SdpI family protein n=1 Tax=Brevundimonas sp. TaxID=1871086 RepID=UPI00391DE5F6
MNQRLNLIDLATAAASLAILAYAAWMLLSGPQGAIPMHYSADGTPTRFGDRMEAGLVIGSMGLMLAGVGWGFAHYARRTNDVSRRRGLLAGQLVTLLTIAATTAFMVMLMTGGALPSPALQMGGVSLLFLAVGAFLGRVGPNVVIGVRTPWAFKSKLAWEKSNRLAGRLFSLLGLTGIVAAPFSPQPAGMLVLIGAIFVAAIWAGFESWRVWRADPDRQPF